MNNPLLYRGVGEGARFGRKDRRKGKGMKVINYKARPVPQVQCGEGRWVGGTGEEVGCGMGSPSARGAEPVRGPADPLKICLEGRTEPRA